MNYKATNYERAEKKAHKIEVESAFRRGCDHASNTAMGLLMRLCPDSAEALEIIKLLHGEFHKMRMNPKKEYPWYTQFAEREAEKKFSAMKTMSEEKQGI